VLFKSNHLLPHTSPLPAIGQSIQILPTVDSTNNYAMAQIRGGTAAHGSCFLALEQTAGKGQRGKTWESATGLNIMLSTVIQAQAPFTQFPFLLSASVALAVFDFFSACTTTEDVQIKWPNDLYWQDRKAGGILIEAIRESGEAFRESSGLKWFVVGMGININQTSFNATVNQRVSLKQITGKHWDVLEMSRKLCFYLDKRFQQLISIPPQEILKNYNQVLYKKEQSVTLKKNNQRFNTKVIEVDMDGRLVTMDQLERKWDVGEVEWVKER
jgi:BirA family biotin operon repressor/biotin-[acetyl-CoA-carboxylase] ligase